MHDRLQKPHPAQAAHDANAAASAEASRESSGWWARFHMRVALGSPEFVQNWFLRGYFLGNRLFSDAPSSIKGVPTYHFHEKDAVRKELDAKLERAISLIEKYDSRWLEHLKRKVKRIVIVPAGTPHFRPVVRSCNIPVHYLLDVSYEELAVVLVHEATHARLYMRGIRWNAENIERIERICVGREVAFALKLPDVGRELAESARAGLRTRWWERCWDPQQREATLRDLSNELHRELDL